MSLQDISRECGYVYIRLDKFEKFFKFTSWARWWADRSWFPILTPLLLLSDAGSLSLWMACNSATTLRDNSSMLLRSRLLSKDVDTVQSAEDVEDERSAGGAGGTFWGTSAVCRTSTSFWSSIHLSGEGGGVSGVTGGDVPDTTEYTDMLGCSISRFSMGEVATLMGPSWVNTAGGISYHGSSSVPSTGRRGKKAHKPHN